MTILYVYGLRKISNCATPDFYHKIVANRTRGDLLTVLERY